MKGMCFVIALTLLVAGCGRMSSNASDVRMVVYQSAGYGFLPMPSNMPLRGHPYLITARGDAQAIVDALNHPDRKGVSRMARNNRLAVVREDGTVMMYGVTAADTINPCDITVDRSSRRLSMVLPAALTRALVAKLTPASPVKSVSYHAAGGKKQLTPAAIAKTQALLKELMKCYCPLALKGNRHCEARDVRNHAQRAPVFLTVRLAKPDAFDVIVATGTAGWPPAVYDTSGRLEQVHFETITVFQEDKGRVRFVFTDSKSSDCLFTDPVDSRRLVKQAQGHNPPVYGPDLFDEAVSSLTKP